MFRTLGLTILLGLAPLAAHAELSFAIRCTVFEGEDQLAQLNPLGLYKDADGYSYSYASGKRIRREGDHWLAVYATISRAWRDPKAPPLEIPGEFLSLEIGEVQRSIWGGLDRLRVISDWSAQNDLNVELTDPESGVTVNCVATRPNVGIKRP
jgi:hypothetical protein